MKNFFESFYLLLRILKAELQIFILYLEHFYLGFRRRNALAKQRVLLTERGDLIAERSDLILRQTQTLALEPDYRQVAEKPS